MVKSGKGFIVREGSKPTFCFDFGTGVFEFSTMQNNSMSLPHNVTIS